MGLTREQIDKKLVFKGIIGKPRAGCRKWLKRQVNKWIRLNKFKLGSRIKNYYKGWEY